MEKGDLPWSNVMVEYMKESDHGSWTMEKGDLPWSNVMVDGVNRRLLV